MSIVQDMVSAIHDEIFRGIRSQPRQSKGADLCLMIKGLDKLDKLDKIVESFYVSLGCCTAIRTLVAGSPSCLAGFVVFG